MHNRFVRQILVQTQPGDYSISGTLADKASGVSATIEKQTMKLGDRHVAPPQFTVDPLTSTASGTPVQFADVAMTVKNDGVAIPTVKVVLRVTKDGQAVEDYPLAQHQALANGSTPLSQRYIPAKGWLKGTYSFAIVISNVSSGT